MDLAPTGNAIAVQECWSRKDISLVFHNIETDATTPFTAGNSKIVPVNLKVGHH